ncbi:hypothetical protein AAFC00_007247 [Neodothiora populina]|uniref:Uncharacterized protein n=1 Tax=Neodothiora populina TaxID=2781224 RepID=A0ABR3PHN6_9PEZI
MAGIQDWATYLIQAGYVTPSYLQPLTTATNIARSYILPIIHKFIEKPDLASIALVLVILFLSLKVLNMLWQAVVFWMRLATRIAFWGGAIVLVLWLANRGFDGAVEDVNYWSRVWSGEYTYWKDQTQSAKSLRGGSAAYGRGY